MSFFFSGSMWDGELDSNQASKDSGSLSAEQVNLSNRVQRLNDRLDTLMVACQAMWELLRDEKDMDENKLIDKMTEVDLRSGKKDGKMSQKKAITCFNCNRPNNAAHRVCLYCSRELTKSDNQHVFNIR